MKILLSLLFTSFCLAGPAESLKKLLEGNERYYSDQSIHPNRSRERREETAALQEPFATIVGCSDSRVAPEIIFDQGVGDLFTVRVAGNVVGPIELDSIEYSVIYLHSSVVLVLGHENCGAVKAVIAGQTQDIEAVAQLIEPAVRETRSVKEGRLSRTIEANVRNVTNVLKKSPALKKLIDEKKLSIVGGVYHFETGQVILNNYNH